MSTFKLLATSTSVLPLPVMEIALVNIFSSRALMLPEPLMRISDSATLPESDIVPEPARAALSDFASNRPLISPEPDRRRFRNHN